MDANEHDGPQAPRRGHLWPTAAALAGVPLLIGAALAWHPPDPTHAAELEGLVTRWLTIHLAVLAGMPLLALILHRLLRNVPGRTASVARLLAIPGAAIYAVFDALLGIGTGVLVSAAGDLPVSERTGAAALAEAWWQVPPVLAVIATLAIVLWTSAVASAAVALVRAGGNRVAGWALALSATLFAAGHPGLTGMAAMVAFTIAVVAVVAVRTAPAAVSSVEGAGRVEEPMRT